MLSLKNLTYRVAGRTLLDNVSLTLSSGYRVGLIGANGTGKTTLFKLIAGELMADGGDISLIAKAKIGMVRQDLPDDDTTLIDVVLAADTERTALFNEAETCIDGERLAEIYERLGAIDAYDAPSRAAIILAGLGFNDDAQQRPISDFSGGWRMRVALAAALFREPDFLLLDEPTNHLDFEAIIWLENYLMRFTGTLLIISHDREMLNKIATHIVQLDQCKLTLYTGNYDQFEQRRAEKLMNQQALHEKQQAQKNKMMAFVTRFGAKASKARQAQSRLKAIQKMDLVDAVMADRVTAFTFPEPDELPPPLITLEHVSVGYEKNTPILKNLNLRIDMEDRIALLGANGNGKSTLIKLLSGELLPLSGDMARPTKLRVGYFAQHQTEALDVTLSAYTIIKEALPTMPEFKVRAMLGRFGFDKQKADTKAGELSGGEKARLLFCLMSYHAPHIMLLDEPTNHLDMDARQALIQALNNYNGCIILVSHDPHLVECVADQLWVVKDGTCTPFNDDLDGYRTMVIQQRRTERSEGKVAAKQGTKEERKAASEQRKQQQARERAQEKAEKEVARLITIRETLEVQIAADSKDEDLQFAYAKLLKELETAEAAWLKAAE